METNSNKEAQVSFSFFRLSNDKKIILLMLCITDFTIFVNLSIIFPFFPSEAALRGVSVVVTGWIFGINSLVQFVLSPFCGKIIHATGTKFAFVTANFILSSSIILFGALQFMPYADGGIMFAIYCFVLRIFTAIGVTLVNVAAFSIIALEFQDSVSVIFGISETFVGLGMVVGPSIGGLLYKTGGFCLPFFVMGSVLLLITILCFFLLPHSSRVDNTPSVSIWNLLRIPQISILCFVVMILESVWSMLELILEPRLTEFHWDALYIGLVFLLMGASYAIFSPVIGWLCQKTKTPIWLMVIGLLGTIVSLLIIGPTALFRPKHEDRSIWWGTLPALFLLGLFFAMGLVPIFECTLSAADDAGFENGLSLYGAVGELWGSSFSLGEFIGPVLGGFLYSSTDFQWCTTIYSGIVLLAMIFVITYIVYQRYTSHVQNFGAVIPGHVNESYFERQASLPVVIKNPQSIGSVGFLARQLGQVQIDERQPLISSQMRQHV